MGRLLQTLLVVLGLSVLAAQASARAPATESLSCRRPTLDEGYVERVSRALRARTDVWGEDLLAAPSGPTYAGAARHLHPLLFARGPRGARLTESGVHYVPFSGQVGADGSSTMALHVADGSQIVSQRASGRSLTIAVGVDGRERFGACLGRLTTGRFAAGYLPVLETRYVDAAGVRYTQRSFATHVRETRSLVSFVEITADAGRSSAGSMIRFTASEPGLATAGTSLVRDGRTFLAFAPGGRVEGGSVAYDVPAGDAREIHVAWLNAPMQSARLITDHDTFEDARRRLSRYWEGRLARGTEIQVPDARVMAAQRALLVQNLGLTWRYSIGNPYQQFSYPEGIDVAQVMSAHGFGPIARAILVKSLGQPPTRYPNWKMGQKLVGSALYYRLYRDRGFIDLATPVLRRYVTILRRQQHGIAHGLLQRERYSSDIPDSVYGLHSQAVVWQGLRAMARVWIETDRPALAAHARKLAAGLEAGLRRAVRRSQRWLSDGSLFLDVRLLDRVKPYESVTASRLGSYWNLVMPYALASGLFPPESREARGVLRYMKHHGSRMLGLVRAGAYALYGLDAAYPESGVNSVYGLNAARFLADNNEADQLVLSLYGQLAVGMTPGTFVAGEAVSVAPLDGEYFRSTYLPPNGASNGSFLETLRLMLVHETRDHDGTPRGLELGFATPRGWLASGRRVSVRRAPTSFGPLSFSIHARENEIAAAVDVPRMSPLRELHLRFRLPPGRRLAAVVVNGNTLRKFDPKTGTVSLPPDARHLEIVARTRHGARARA